MTTWEPTDQELTLLSRYQDAHLAYLQVARPARPAVFGIRLRGARHDNAALSAARQRLDTARDELRKYWASASFTQEVAR
jgi:hypothetical protein